MRRLIDCHVHTDRCGHATGKLEEYVAAGVERGLFAMIMTDHLPLPEDLDPDHHLSMPADELDDYLRELDDARGRYDHMRVLSGIEADWLPERSEEMRAGIERARRAEPGVHIVLGSVHFLDGWAFDDPHHLQEWDHRDVDATWLSYFEQWCDAARSGLFDVMAHPDLVKKFGHFPTFDPRELYEAAAAAAASSGVAIEVSTAGLRKPVGELYPGTELLRAFRTARVPATVGSDAHEPAEVGYALDLAYAALEQVGYDRVVLPLGSGAVEEVSL